MKNELEDLRNEVTDLKRTNNDIISQKEQLQLDLQTQNSEFITLNTDLTKTLTKAIDPIINASSATLIRNEQIDTRLNDHENEIKGIQAILYRRKVRNQQ